MIAKARQVYSINRRKIENVIAAPKGYDSIREHLGEHADIILKFGCVDRLKRNENGMTEK